MGGREAIMDEFDNPPPPKPAPKKRGRAPAVKSEPSANGKRQKSSHPKDTSPPASTDASWSGPPSGSWEDHVQGIDACEGADGNIMVFLSWKGGKKSQHSLSQVYKKCPQKVK
jgi:chromobox protein 1